MSYVKAIVGSFFILFFLFACASKPQLIKADGVSTLDIGIPILGHNLLAPISDEKALILLEPFKEANLHDEIDSSNVITKLLLDVSKKETFSKLTVISTVNASDNDFKNARYIIRGIISYENYSNNSSTKRYKVMGFLADKKTGLKITHDYVWVYDVSYGKYAQELPVTSVDRTEKIKSTEIQQEQAKITVDDIEVSADISKAKSAYRNGQYAKAKDIISKLLVSSPNAQTLDIYKMLYLANLRLTKFDEAEDAFANLIKVGFHNSNKMPLMFVFPSGKSVFYPDNTQEYDVWIRQLVNYMNANERKCMLIIGHTSKPGDFDYNMRLSKERANYIAAKLAQKSKYLSKKISTDGKGETETIVGTDTDGEQNILDRRVEFELSECR